MAIVTAVCTFDIVVVVIEDLVLILFALQLVLLHLTVGGIGEHEEGDNDEGAAGQRGQADRLSSD